MKCYLTIRLDAQNLYEGTASSTGLKFFALNHSPKTFAETIFS